MTQGIIMAAGMGRRMRGATNNTPKSLMRVSGLSLLERNIDYMLQAGFERIIVVVGYKKDEFSFLLDKYDPRKILLVDNSLFDKGNTITSLYYARDFLDTDTYISTADIYLATNVYEKYTSSSCFYLLRPNERYEKPDWIAHLDSSGKFASVDLRGTQGHGYTGISYWSNNGALLLKNLLNQIDLEDETQANRYWDELILELIPNIELYGIVIEQSNELYEFDDVQDIRLFESKEGIQINFKRD
ncbi:NTP transferase domain-containing protein [Collinsella bouchesdurhonensis]|uniref:NTP transferase domain-containing protein n=1 Tax=Collinsella bouchesdurhonensis TaxID=1907654 RepID=UPI003F8B9738